MLQQTSILIFRTNQRSGQGARWHIRNNAAQKLARELTPRVPGVRLHVGRAEVPKLPSKPRQGLGGVRNVQVGAEPVGALNHPRDEAVVVVDDNRGAAWEEASDVSRPARRLELGTVVGAGGRASI